MRILISHHAFADFAGTESYIHTVAVALQRLGHDVTVYAERTGPMAAFSRERGVRVVETTGALPDSCDALLAHDAGTAFSLGERYPGARRVFVAHSDYYALQIPPQLDGLCQAIIVLNDRVRRSVEAQAFHAPIIRLRQPIDTRRFVGRGGARGGPRRALLLGNYLNGPPVQRLDAACRAAGIELVLAGARSTPTSTPERAIADADVVFGLGRCVLEAMACARAAYVHGVAGGDGWVTTESYPAIEADGFAGTATPDVIDPDRLTADLRAWSPDLAAAGRALVTAHHDADAHAADLVAVLGDLGAPSAPARAPAEELERLVRLEWQTWSLYDGALDEIRTLRDALDEQGRGVQELHRTLAERERRLAEQERVLADQHHTLTEQHRILDEQISELDRLAQLSDGRAARRHPWARRIAAPLHALRRRM